LTGLFKENETVPFLGHNVEVLTPKSHRPLL